VTESWAIESSGQPLSLRWYRAALKGEGRAEAARRTTLILAPGAGAGHDHGFMVSLASALAARTVDVVTFNFPYAEAGRRRPDPPRVLEQAWIDAATAVGSRPGLAAQPWFIGGKSMGGRLATQVVAAGAITEPRLTGIVCVGYPLRPPGRPAPRAVDHWTRLRVPMLVLQGTRDAFGGPEALRAAAHSAGATPTVQAIDGADHGFAVPRRTGLTTADVIAGLADGITTWMTEVCRGQRPAQGDAR
jgi:hypothetical protein